MVFLEWRKKAQPGGQMIFKIMSAAQWQEFARNGVFLGAPVDLADGFIHFSTALQVIETARKHFSGLSDLVLVAVARERIVEGLIDEPSRGGDLFPHLYAPLSLEAVLWAQPLLMDSSGQPVFPKDLIFPKNRDSSLKHAIYP
jgi:uncharacterized protein (DUF952 family)